MQGWSKIGHFPYTPWYMIANSELTIEVFSPEWKLQTAKLLPIWC